MKEKSLNDLLQGETAIIKKLYNKGTMRRRLIDLGFAPQSVVGCAFCAPLGDPKAFIIKNTIIALREEDSSLIKVSIL
ncbi:MAG: ferrous iron transport protein A [Clostridia bacterium]|nr:ferrous iron transport protein A [Clostridia bacterium]